MPILDALGSQGRPQRVPFAKHCRWDWRYLSVMLWISSWRRMCSKFFTGRIDHFPHSPYLSPSESNPPFVMMQAPSRSTRTAGLDLPPCTGREPTGPHQTLAAAGSASGPHTHSPPGWGTLCTVPSRDSQQLRVWYPEPIN